MSEDLMSAFSSYHPAGVRRRYIDAAMQSPSRCCWSGKRLGRPTSQKPRRLGLVSVHSGAQLNRRYHLSQSSRRVSIHRDNRRPTPIGQWTPGVDPSHTVCDAKPLGNVGLPAALSPGQSVTQHCRHDNIRSDAVLPGNDLVQQQGQIRLAPNHSRSLRAAALHGRRSTKHTGHTSVQ